MYRKQVSYVICFQNPSPPGSTNTYFVADCNPEKVEEIDENSLCCLPPLAESFKTLIGNQSYSDMIVEFVEESQTDRDTLHLHKCVLHCRCPQLLEVWKQQACITLLCLARSRLQFVIWNHLTDEKKSFRLRSVRVGTCVCLSVNSHLNVVFARDVLLRQDNQ